MPKEIAGLKPQTLFYRDYEDGALEEGQIKVKVDFAAPKHGTELAEFRGTDPHLSENFDSELNLFLKDEEKAKGDYLFTPGNMWVGNVVETKGATGDICEGQRVAGYGPLKETQVLPAGKALIMSPSMTWREAVCFDPMQFALSGVRDSMARPGDTVCVFGLGAIGLLAVQLAKLAGASLVVACDPIKARREVAMKTGAHIVFDPTTTDVGLELKKLTDKRGCDAIVETSGTYPALQASLRGIAYGGKISVVGWYKPCSGGLDLGREAHFNNATVFFSRACSEPYPDHPRWTRQRGKDECWKMLSSGMICCEDIVYPVVEFAAAADAYIDVVDKNPDKSIKLGVRY